MRAIPPSIDSTVALSSATFASSGFGIPLWSLEVESRRVSFRATPSGTLQVAPASIFRGANADHSSAESATLSTMIGPSGRSGPSQSHACEGSTPAGTVFLPPPSIWRP